MHSQVFSAAYAAVNAIAELEQAGHLFSAAYAAVNLEPEHMARVGVFSAAYAAVNFCNRTGGLRDLFSAAYAAVNIDLWFREGAGIFSAAYAAVNTPGQGCDSATTGEEVDGTGDDAGDGMMAGNGWSISIRNLSNAMAPGCLLTACGSKWPSETYLPRVYAVV